MNAPARQPARILMTADGAGGVWTYALELARALEPSGIEIVLATMGPPLTRAQQLEAAALSGLQLCESGYRLEWMSHPWADVERAGEWLLGLAGQHRPDLVHLNGYVHGALPWDAPVVVVGHSCVLSWWRAVRGGHAPAEWNSYRDAVTEGLQLADLVVAPSQAMLAALTEQYGPFAAATVIPNGRRLPGLRPRAKHDFILAAGRLWDEAKNISGLAMIAPRLSWPVYIAGEKAHPDGRGVRHANVHHLGCLATHEMISWFERAAIYAFPARYEPFGLSVLEAALAGCALVLGDIPSLRETWQAAALFVPPDDTLALADTIERLIRSPHELTRRGALARSIAQQFTPEQMAAGYLAAYRQARQRRAPARTARHPSTRTRHVPAASPADGHAPSSTPGGF